MHYPGHVKSCPHPGQTDAIKTAGIAGVYPALTKLKISIKSNIY
jgi:hypothetical protein